MRPVQGWCRGWTLTHGTGGLGFKTQITHEQSNITISKQIQEGDAQRGRGRSPEPQTPLSVEAAGGRGQVPAPPHLSPTYTRRGSDRP